MDKASLFDQIFRLTSSLPATLCTVNSSMSSPKELSMFNGMTNVPKINKTDNIKDLSFTK